ncbi:MAG: glutathione S-transferase family protein [Rhodoblastus sp.]|nr:glutathione S-transferase family protein [Rhodoblastus sp.]
MILIGQYDSPFVRRVAIALRLYGRPFEHRPWSTFGDADQLAAYNPLRRVPTLVRDDGAVLIESSAILDWLDEQAGERALIPRHGEARRAQLHVCALGQGLAEKSVALLYERVLHEQVSDLWTTRCRAQISDTLAELERSCAKGGDDFWFGATMGHADIMVACALRFLKEAHAGLFDPAMFPQLEALSQRCEATETFREIVQPLIPPK